MKVKPKTILRISAAKTGSIRVISLTNRFESGNEHSAYLAILIHSITIKVDVINVLE